MAKTRRGMSMGKFNAMVRRAMATTHVTRVRIYEDDLTPAQSPKNYTLLTCDDDPDYDLTTSAGVSAEIQPLKRINNIRLTLGIGNIDSSKTLEFILYKDPDGMLAALPPSTLFTSDVSPTTTAIRKNTLAYGLIGPASSNTDSKTVRIRIRRKAMRRAGVFKDGDLLRMVITNTNVIDSLEVTIVGTITWG